MFILASKKIRLRILVLREKLKVGIIKANPMMNSMILRKNGSAKDNVMLAKYSGNSRLRFKPI